MKNFFKILGITALALVIGFGFITCDDGEKNSGGCTHNWQWVETTAATVSAGGVETKTCSLCDATDGTRVIPHLLTGTWEHEEENYTLTFTGANYVLEYVGNSSGICTKGTFVSTADAFTLTLTHLKINSEKEWYTTDEVFGEGNNLDPLTVPFVLTATTLTISALESPDDGYNGVWTKQSASAQVIAIDFRGTGYAFVAIDAEHYEDWSELTIEKTSISWDGGSFTNLYTAGGGEYDNGEGSGKWAYLYKSGTKIGIIIKPYGYYICVYTGESAKNSKDSIEYWLETTLDLTGVGGYPCLDSD